MCVWGGGVRRVKRLGNKGGSPLEVRKSLDTGSLQWMEWNQCPQHLGWTHASENPTVFTNQREGGGRGEGADFCVQHFEGLQ